MSNRIQGRYLPQTDRRLCIHKVRMYVFVVLFAFDLPLISFIVLLIENKLEETFPTL